MIILEEAAFMKPEVFNVVCVPLLGVDGTVMIGISTPDDEDNYYSVLLTKTKSDGTPLFRVMLVGLACEDCKKKGQAEKCSHKLFLLPSWKSEEGQELQRHLLSEETYRRESQGEVLNQKIYGFNKADIDEFTGSYRKAPYRLMNRGRVVFLVIDPSAGGRSEMALLAMVFGHENSILVSASSLSSYQPVNASLSCITSSYTDSIR